MKVDIEVKASPESLNKGHRPRFGSRFFCQSHFFDKMCGNGSIDHRENLRRGEIVNRQETFCGDDKSLFITFYEADLGGVVFFANTFKLAHRFIESFIVDQGISWKIWFNNSDWAVPLKHASCEYMRPLFAGKDCTGQVTLAKLGRSSMAFETRLLQDGKVCAVVKTVHVFVCLKTRTKMEVPKVIKAQFVD